MKALLISSMLIVCFLISKAQPYNSSCDPSGVMESTYRNDAARLAIKRLHDISSPLADSVIIPEILIDSIKKALYAVNNIQNNLVVDTLRPIFGYSNFLPNSDSTHFVSASVDLRDAFQLKYIKVIVNNNTAWGAQWMSGNYNATSNNSVNYLINKHQLEVLNNSYQLYTDSTIYFLHSPLAINARALAGLFEIIPGTVSAYAIGSPGSGNIIQTEFNKDGIKISLS
jgi:hypothetical protein